ADTGLKAILYLPLLLEGEAIGLFTIDFWNTSRNFLPEEIALCEAATHHVVMAMKNARVYESETKRRREAELLHELTAYLVETLDVDQIFGKAIALLRSYLTYISHCRFLIMDDSGDYLIPTHGWRDARIPQPLFRTEPILIRETFATKQCLQEKRPVIITDLRGMEAQNERALEFFNNGMRSLLYVPLLSNDQVVGMLQIDVWDEPYQFDEEEIALCQAVANHVAISIERSELIALQGKQLQLSDTLREVGALLTSRLKPEEIFERIFDLLARVLPYNTVSLQLFDAKRNQMTLAAGRGFRNIELAAKIVNELGLRSLLLMTDKPFRIIRDTEENGEWIQIEDFEPIRSSISCALRIKDHLIGVLNIDSFRPDTYDEKMAGTAMAFANQAVVAIENSRLYEQINQRALELSVLNQIAVLGAAVETLDELFAVTTQIVTNSLFPHNFGFLLLDESRQYLLLHPSYHNHSNWPLPERVALASSLSGQVVHTKKPFMGSVAQKLNYFPINESTQVELIVPLVVNGEVIGVINVEDDKPNAFTERDLNFLETLTGQLSVAIQRVQLYEDSQFYAAELEDKVALRTLELEQEKDRMSAILDSVGEGVIFTDADGMIQYANPALCIQSGYDMEELFGRPSFMLSSSEENDESIFNAIRFNAARRERWRGELVNIRKDGTFYEVIATVTPVLNHQDELAGFVTIQSDITHFKEIERLKSEFVTNVSHELRTPLTNIKTFLALLKRGRPEKRERYQDILEREADRLARLIQDLLDLSQLDTHSVKTKLKPIALEQIVAESTQAFQAKAEAKEIDIEVVATDPLPPMLADRDQIHQVTANLLGNAIAYTPERGHIVITLQTADFEGRPMVTMSVTDSGIGILEEERDKLFDRFFRGHAAHESRSPGTGLGLAISKEIVERHNGRIEVNSQPNAGTTITVWLPIAE
ncbi:MAG: GAF domain-containing protein, partial [Anaerolineales bacterium]|nr:GAF domain-containing protein [Anaerolineales bacterium]